MNQVKLIGKVSRGGKLAYTPAGEPVFEFNLSIPQEHFRKRSMGAMDMVLTGTLAEELKDRIRIGVTLEVEGSLYIRQFKDRDGRTVKQTTVLVSSIQEDKSEKKRR